MIVYCSARESHAAYEHSPVRYPATSESSSVRPSSIFTAMFFAYYEFKPWLYVLDYSVAACARSTKDEKDRDFCFPRNKKAKAETVDDGIANGIAKTA